MQHKFENASASLFPKDLIVKHLLAHLVYFHSFSTQQLPEKSLMNIFVLFSKVSSDRKNKNKNKICRNYTDLSITSFEQLKISHSLAGHGGSDL